MLHTPLPGQQGPEIWFLEKVWKHTVKTMGEGEKRYRKAASRFWLSWFRLMILALERRKEKDQRKHWTLSKLEANITYIRPCRKQLVPDQQYSALLCSFAYHLQSSTQQSLPPS